MRLEKANGKKISEKIGRSERSNHRASQSDYPRMFSLRPQEETQ
jgi:hypothetical protein